MSLSLTKLSVFLSCFLVPMAATQAGIIFNVNQQMTSNAPSDALDTNVLVEQQGNALKFTLTVDASITNNVGDLQGIFFHVANETLINGLIAIGTDVTGQLYDANNVSNLGNGVVMNGGGLSPFDAGIKIGTSGIGHGDDFRTTMFVLSHATQALDLNSFFKVSTGPTDYVMAIRATSVGVEGGNRGGSSKTATTGGTTTTTTTTGGQVPEPGTATIWMASVLICVVSRSRRKA